MSHTLKSAVERICVIIPVKGRFNLLVAALRSVADAQDLLAPDATEVVVVWDGPESPEQRVSEFCSHSDLKVRCLFAAGSPAHKRNIGAESSDSEVALFLDSDCVIERNLLKALFHCFRRPETVALATPVVFSRPASVLEEAAAIMPYRIAFGWAARQRPLWWAPTASLAVRRRPFLALGGFWSPSYGPARAEDVDLGLRWTKALGRPAVDTLPEHPSSHARETWAGVWSSLSRAWWFGWSEGDLLVRHPAFERWSPPPLLAGGIVLLLLATALHIAGRFSAALIPVVGTILLSSWLVVRLYDLFHTHLRLLATPAALLLAGVFELGRTISLWRTGCFTKALWFHEDQPVGAWRESVAIGWILWAVGTGLALYSIWLRASHAAL